RLTEIIPSTPISNYAFYNDKHLSFVNKASEWGLGEPGFSNGSAYGDLDNDGDLDLVVNNVNMPSFIYRNQVEKLFPNHNFLKVILRGETPNSWAIGSSVTVSAGDKKFYLEQIPMKGFQSSVDPRLNFGLGEIDTLDNVVVRWPDGKITELKSVATNQTIELHHSDATAQDLDGMMPIEAVRQVFHEISDELGIS